MSLTKKFSDFSSRVLATLTGDTHIVGYEGITEVRFEIDQLILFLNVELTDTFVDKATAQTVNGIKTFGSIPVLPASNPTTDNQAVRKKYADDTFVDKVNAQTVNGIKTFGSIPVLPNSDPTTDNQATRKKYTDDKFLPFFANVILVSSNVTISSANEATYKGAVLLIDSNITVTFGTGLSSGFQCVLVRNGAGEATIAASGTTINSEDSKKRINIRYGGASAVVMGVNVILLMGNLKT